MGRTGAPLFFLILVATLLAPAADGQLVSYCGDSGKYTANSTYHANIQRLAATLPENTSSSRDLFATATFGAFPDVVYALALCRGDVADATSCGSCVAAAFRDAQRLCAGARDAAAYRDACYARFSNINFLATTGNDDLQTYESGRNVSAPPPFAAFDAAVGELLNATADRAAAAANVAPRRRFAAGAKAFGADNVDAIYALAQCTPDMELDDCRSCLSGILRLAPAEFSGSTSGWMIGARCNYRYDLYQFFSGTPQMMLPAPALPPDDQVPVGLTTLQGPGKKIDKSAKIAAAVACSFFLVLMIVSVLIFVGFKRRKAFKKQNTQAPVIPRSTSAAMKAERGKCAIFDLPTLQEATNSFHEDNKLGEGGFGTVYRGVLSDGQEIAVKLSRNVTQGLSQLHNEVQVLAILQHKNLVRLLGFCSQQDEIMLVYEHVMNGSLDKYLFDTSRGTMLNWEQRYNIILGIAKGILYLHEDSRLRMVHRDLKANNILLDENMNPKIADFGLARLFTGDHTQSKTSHVVGTYGYMAPEYAMFGNVSPKTDVFSFGVLLLEIVTGRRNGSSDDPDSDAHLLTEVWKYWIEGRALQLVQQSQHGYSESKALRCIHIGLLCVQQHPNDRPKISSVVLMLTRSRIELQPPRQPAFFFGEDPGILEGFNGMVNNNLSVNGVTNTDPYPR